MLLIDLHGEFHVPSLKLLAQAAVPVSQVHQLSSRLQKDTQFVKNVVERAVSGQVEFGSLNIACILLWQVALQLFF